MFSFFIVLFVFTLVLMNAIFLTLGKLFKSYFGQKECRRSLHLWEDLEKGVDPGNVVPTEKWTVVELHENFQRNPHTFVEYKSHLVWYCTFKKFAVYENIRISSTAYNLVFLEAIASLVVGLSVIHSHTHTLSHTLVNIQVKQVKQE